MLSAQSLGFIKDRAAVNPLIGCLSDPEDMVKVTACQALGRLGDPIAADKIAPLLTSPTLEVRIEAAFALSTFKDLRAVPTLIDLLASPKVAPILKGVIAGALARLGDPRAVEPLIQYLKQAKGDEKVRAISALGLVHDTRAVDALCTELTGDYLYAALSALQTIGDRHAVPALIGLLKTWKDDTTKDQARNNLASTLKALTGQDFGQDTAKWEAWWKTQTK